MTIWSSWTLSPSLALASNCTRSSRSSKARRARDRPQITPSCLQMTLPRQVMAAGMRASVVTSPAPRSSSRAARMRVSRCSGASVSVMGCSVVANLYSSLVPHDVGHTPAVDARGEVTTVVSAPALLSVQRGPDDQPGRGAGEPAAPLRQPGPALSPLLPPLRARLSGGGPAKHHPLQQRVARQPVGAVHPGAGHLAAGVEAGDGGRPVQVGDHAANGVVGGGSDRDGSQDGVDAIAPAGGDDGREALGEALADAAAVEEDRCAAGPRHLFPDRPGDDVAGGQLSPGVGVEKEAAPVCVHDQSALATNRLADEEGGGARQREDGGVELDELDVGDVGARLIGESDAVAGGPGRVGGVAPEGGCPAGREDHGAGGHPRPLPGGGIAELDPDATVTVPDQAGDYLTLEDRGGALVEALQQGGLDGGAGGIAAGMEDPSPAVSRLAVEVDAVPVAVECNAPLGQLGHPSRSLLDHQAHRPLAAEAAASGHGVLEVQLRGIVGGPRGGDPALGGGGAAVVSAALG